MLRFVTKRCLRWVGLWLIFEELVCGVVWWGWSMDAFLNDW